MLKLTDVRRTVRKRLPASTWVQRPIDGRRNTKRDRASAKLALRRGEN